MIGASLSAEVKTILIEQGYYVINVIAASEAGVSDLVACTPCGRFIALEIKGKGDDLKPLQIDKLNKVNACNGIGLEIRSIANLAILRTHLRAGTSPPALTGIKQVIL